MSNKFEGFSEEYIRRYKNPSAPGQNKSNNELRKAALKTKCSIGKQTLPSTQNNRVQSVDDTLIEAIPDDARLSLKSEAKIPHETNSIVANGHISEMNSNKECIIEQTNVLVNPTNKLLDLSEFEAQQKLIEEENKRKKELLARALANKKKKTHEEALRLEMIQQEFKKLDTLLSNDVSILRNQIEIASYEFMEAQKHFDKLEKEYSVAKLSLHQKRERKNLLTEHLCTIIQQNELRKSEKLSVLMSKLEVCDDAISNSIPNSEAATEPKSKNKDSCTESL